MAGSFVDDSSESTNWTFVLVGSFGCGKSQTSNSILRRKAFISTEVTKTCELQTSVLEDGKTISVIDTPGFVDTEPELLGEEVKKCFNLARNKIHAILFVVAMGSSGGETVAIETLQTIFGKDVIKYVIIVFTGYTRPLVPSKFNEIVRLCEGRYVIFDNRTEDAVKWSEQVQNLLSQVKTVISQNGGKPFMSQELELQFQAERTKGWTRESEQRLVEAHATTMNAEEVSKLIQQLNKSNQEQMTQRIDAVEARLRDTTTSLEQKMETGTMNADERAKKYFKEATSELIQQISKSYEEQMTQRLEAVEQRALDTTTRLEQQLAEAYAAQMKVNRVNKIARQQMKQRINEEVEQRVLYTATRLEQQLAEAHAAQMKANEIAQQQMTQRMNEEVELRVKDVTIRLEQQLAEAEAARLKADERAQEAQKNSEEHIQKLKEALERAESRMSESIPEFRSSSFHVYDPSTYELQSGIK